MPRWLTASALSLTAPLLAAAPALAQGGGYYRDNWGPHMMWGFGGGWFGWLFMIAFWVLVIAVIVWGVRLLTGRGGGGSATQSRPAGGGAESALEVLKRRYAAGEIDRDQYLAMRKDLEG